MMRSYKYSVKLLIHLQFVIVVLPVKIDSVSSADC